MSRYWSNTVKNIKPYTPGEQPKDRKYIKLNTNENPYPPSSRVIEAIKNAADVTFTFLWQFSAKWICIYDPVIF